MHERPDAGRGLPDVTGATGVTSRTGPTGPTATGTTGAAGGEAFSLDFSPAAGSGISDFAFFTCNGLEGTWHYILNADFGQGIALDIDAEVDMAGGDGTLVFGGQFDVPDAGSVSFTDTIELRLIGRDTLEATSVSIEVDTNIPGSRTSSRPSAKATGCRSSPGPIAAEPAAP